MLHWFMIPNALKCEQIQHYYKAIPTQLKPCILHAHSSEAHYTRMVTLPFSLISCLYIYTMYTGGMVRDG